MRRSHPAGRWGPVAGLLGVTALVGGGAVGLLAPSVGALYGLGDLGPVVDAGLPAARIVALGAAAMAAGLLLVASVYVPGEPGGTVSPDGYRSLLAARWWAAAGALAAAVVTVLTVAENLAMPPAVLLAQPAVFANAVAVLAPAAGWALTALGLLAVACWAAIALSWRSSVGLTALAALSITPVTLTTSTNAEQSHDILGDAMTAHGLAALLWFGSALAVAVHLGRRGSRADAALRRHGVLATVCLLVVASSGLVTAAVQIGPGALLTSGYGLLLVLSTVLLVPAGVVLRRSTAVSSRGGPRAALGLLAVECVVLAAASGAGTALVRVFPPDQTVDVSREVYLIGYELPPHLTALDLATFWRWDTLFGTVAALAAAWYLWGVAHVRRAGGHWPAGRTVSWLAGCAVLLLATSSGLGAYGPAVFSVHMVQHMLLATLVPVLLVLGHGVSLALELSGPGARVRILDLLDSPAVRLVRFPLVAWLAVAVSLFGLYATGYYEAIAQQHWAHLSMQTVFLGTGLALYWPVLGHDRGERGLPPIARIVMVFAVMGLHAAFASWLLSRAQPVAAPFFTSLRLPYVPDLLADQRRGAVLAWMIGEVPTLIAVAALVHRWTRTDRTQPDAVRTDRPGQDADPDRDRPAHPAVAEPTASATRVR